MNIHHELAKRIGLLYEPGNPHVLLSFFRTNTSQRIDPAIEDEFITLQTTIPALAELYLHLRQAVESNPEEYGFKKTL